MKEAGDIGATSWGGSSPASPLAWDWVPSAPLRLSLSLMGTVLGRQRCAVPGGAGRASSQREARACPALQQWWWQWLTWCQGAGGALAQPLAPSRVFCPCPLPVWEMLGCSSEMVIAPCTPLAHPELTVSSWMHSRCQPIPTSQRNPPVLGVFCVGSEVSVAVTLATQGHDSLQQVQMGFDSLHVPFPGVLCLQRVRA